MMIMRIKMKITKKIMKKCLNSNDTSINLNKIKRNNI